MRHLPYAFLLISLLLPAPSHGFEEEIRPILERSCVRCHGGEKLKGKVDLAGILTAADADGEVALWETVVEVIEAGEMPPEDEPPLADADKATLLAWIQRRAAEPIPSHPAVFKPRRLSAPEYRNTLRSLFGFDLEVAVAPAEQTAQGETSLVLKLLPTDPPGSSGFVNDTHGARLSGVTWEQYSHLADAALERLFSRSGREQLGTQIGEALSEDWTAADFTPEQAEALLRGFLPRAQRRRVPEVELTKRLTALAGKKGNALVEAAKFELKASLMSPAFLYRGLLMEGEPSGQQPVDEFELAERLSYFLWEDMPDDELLSLAAKGSLSDPAVVDAQVDRMLASPRSRTLSESFAAQWLELNSLDELLLKDPIRLHAVKTQPLDFFHYLVTEDRPVMELVDSEVTFVNQGTSGFYGKDRNRMEKYVTTKGIERQTTPNQRLVLEHAEGRGGILTMPGILTMNQGPIQRGTWILRRILGEQLGEPPADVPAIKPSPRGKKLTFRERFEAHRSDPSCARCHEKIDPLGFALEGYDKNGQFLLASDRPKPKDPIDTTGRLPSGESFTDFEQLKGILLTSQREPIVRNIVEQTLAYALCRKLTRSDLPTVDTITRDLCENDGSWKQLFQQVANSLPFRETIIESAETSHE